MTRFRWPYPLLLLVLAVGLVIQPRPAVTQECDQTIADRAELFGDRLADVQTAVQRLEDAGAVVRVVTMRDMGQFGNLDQWEADRLRHCSSWQSAEGDRRANLVVLAISMAEKQSLISYGGEWSSVLDEQKVYVRKQAMGPRFKDGEFAQGFINGLDKITDLIKTKSMPQPATPSAPIVVKESGPPPDLSGLWKVFGWLLGLAALFTAVWLISRFIRSSREERERRAAAQLKAQTSKSACSTLILEAGQPDALPQMLPIKLNELGKLVTPVVMRPLRARLEKGLTAMNAAKTRFATANTVGNDPIHDHRSVDEYQEMERSFRPISAALETAKADLEALDRDIDKLQQQAATAPATVKAAGNFIGAANDEIEKAAKQGFHITELAAALDTARASLTAAQQALDNHDGLEAIAKSVQVSEQCTKIIQAAMNMPQRRDQLSADLAKVQARIPTVEQAIANGRTVFTVISTIFAASSWTNIQGNGTEAEKRVALVKQMLDPIAAALAMDKQDWDTAGNSIARANERLDAAESMMRSIVALQQHLEAAQTEVPRELESARADLAKATVYEREHDADIDDGIKTQLRDAEHLITEAAAELQKPQPDYLVAGQMTQRANQATDAILDKGRSEVEAAERLRQKAVSTLRSAAHAVSTAKEYIEDHSRDVDDDARQQLTQAQAALAKANSAKAAASQVTLGEAALAAAQQARATAESQFEAAEARRRNQERIEEERREEAHRSVIISSPSHHHDYGGWGSGGSSSGGFSIGGGGSSSGGFSIGGGGSSSGGW